MGHLNIFNCPSSVGLLFGSLAWHKFAYRVVPADQNSIVPVVAYGITCFCLRKTFPEAHSLLFALHALLTTLVFYNVSPIPYLLRRFLIFPLAGSALAFALSAFIPITPSRLSVAAVLMLQFWSVLGGAVMLAVFPAAAVSAIEPQSVREEALLKCLRGTEEHRGERFLATVPRNGAQIDVVVFLASGDVAANRWVLYLGGNAELMENSCREVPTMTDIVPRANWIFFNPRGVGRSSGHVTSVHDLVDDAAAVVRSATKRYNIDGKQLLLWGHSIGGGVAAALARTHCPTSPLLLDRTFSRLTDAAVRFSPLPASITQFVVRHATGELNTVADCAAVSAKKVVVFHKEDEVISFATASLGRPDCLKQIQTNPPVVIELRRTNVMSPHNSLLSSFERTKDLRQSVENLFT